MINKKELFKDVSCQRMNLQISPVLIQEVKVELLKKGDKLNNSEIINLCLISALRNLKNKGKNEQEVTESSNY